MAKQIYNPFHLRPEFIEKQDLETRATRNSITQKFIQKAARHSVGTIVSSARVEGTAAPSSGMRDKGAPIKNPVANAIAISQPRQNAMKAVMNNTSRPLSTTMVVVTSFISPFDEEEEPEANDARGPRSLPKRRKTFGSGVSLAPTTVHSRMKAYLKGAQPAVVKMAGTGGGIQSASSLMRYVSRNAAMPMERENGQQITTLQQQNDMLKEWQHYFDKREPSRDVVTLTVNIKKSEIDPHYVQDALASVYKDQRLVSGIAHTENQPNRIIAVMTIASNKKGRIKTTDHALNQIRDSLHKQHGLGIDDINLSYSEVAHGVYGLKQHFKAALAEAKTLEGPKDQNITIDNYEKTARSWRRSLRSSGNRDIMHVIVSARAGTDQNAFLKSARSFLAHEFGDHKYAFALHGPDDSTVDKRSGEGKATPHVHIHAMIVMRSVHDQKLNPYVKDFHRWRENMAYFARENGIDMVATKRGETLTSEPYSKNEHEMTKKGKADKRTIDKVEAKRQGKKKAPKGIKYQEAAAQANHAVKELLQDTDDTNDQNFLASADAMLSTYKRFDEIIPTETSSNNYDLEQTSEQSDKTRGREKLQAYEDAMFSVFNAHSFYQKYGVIDPMIDSVNEWSQTIIKDLKDNEISQIPFVMKGAHEFTKIYDQLSAAFNSTDNAEYFREKTIAGASHISTIDNRNINNSDEEMLGINNHRDSIQTINR
ncbi:hypothetical protein [Bartonella choladocola]|uniref:Conjugal transfer protein TraA n=1 Tax=Bartonella choladocola TaxID=2750995 RepID=A0A1U9MJP5_9HYPH|nr:hypothetical protein [Bartonella choladocola]AQT47940.1 hypothetical protein BBC0122_018430 [Bartonella choladocola]